MYGSSLSVVCVCVPVSESSPFRNRKNMVAVIDHEKLYQPCTGSSTRLHSPRLLVEHVPQSKVSLVLVDERAPQLGVLPDDGASQRRGAKRDQPIARLERRLAAIGWVDKALGAPPSWARPVRA